MKYIDSNVFIFSFLTNDDNSKLCQKILEKVAEGRLQACTCVLTWDEITWIAKKVFGKEDSVTEGKKFFEFPYLSILNVTESIVRIAQNLIEKYAIDPRDAIHAAAAISSGCNKLISDDTDFDKIKEIKRISPKDFE